MTGKKANTLILGGNKCNKRRVCKMKQIGNLKNGGEVLYKKLWYHLQIREKVDLRSTNLI